MLLHGAHGVLHRVFHTVFAGYYETNWQWLMLIKGDTKLPVCNHWISLLSLMCCWYNISVQVADTGSLLHTMNI